MVVWDLFGEWMVLGWFCLLVWLFGGVYGERDVRVSHRGFICGRFDGLILQGEARSVLLW